MFSIHSLHVVYIVLCYLVNDVVVRTSEAAQAPMSLLARRLAGIPLTAKLRIPFADHGFDCLQATARISLCLLGCRVQGLARLQSAIRLLAGLPRICLDGCEEYFLELVYYP